jgi:hypothetical protein
LYYHARYYNPVLARFLSPDTLVPDPKDPQDLNRYTYAKNNPLRYTDPTGHCIFGLDTVVCIAGGYALLVGIASYVAVDTSTRYARSHPISSQPSFHSTVDSGDIEKRVRVRGPLPKNQRPTTTDNNKLGEWAESEVDKQLKSEGWKRIGGHEDRAGSQGIDGVYERETADGEKEYMVEETKYNSSDYGNTKDGKQMSEKWIDNRLDDAVGDRDKVEDIRSRGYSRRAYRVYPDGSIYEEVITWK